MSPNAANGFQHGSSTSLGSITGAYGRTGSTQSLSPASPDPNSKTMSGARIMDKKWEGMIVQSIVTLYSSLLHPVIIAEVQKKTFTKWVNMQLEKGRIEPIQGLSEGK